MMYHSGFGGGFDSWGWGYGFPVLVPSLLIGFVVWSLLWKGLALWHAARREDKWWFLVFLVVNTVGILEIVYLFGFCKLKFNELFSSHR